MEKSNGKGLQEVVESFRKGKDLDTSLSQTRTTRTDYEKRGALIPTIIDGKKEERTDIDFAQVQNNLTIVTNSLIGIEDQRRATKKLSELNLKLTESESSTIDQAKLFIDNY